MSVLDLAPAAPLPSTPIAGMYTDLADIELLHSISVELIGEQDCQTLYGKIVDAAMSITGSQFGTMQLLCPPQHPSGHGGELQLLCSRGFTPETVAVWQWVSPAAYSSCTQALKMGERAIIPDFERWPDIAGTDDLQAFRHAGIRAAQTTPLRSRSGTLLGMISTHWREPHQPSLRDLRLLDIVARQAADLLERTLAETALRELNETLEQRVAERTALLLQAEEKLHQSQKMEAVGQLTGGLAHDFNNLLAGVSGALEMMNRRIVQGRLHEVDKYMTLAQGATTRAAALTHRLLAFSRRQTLDPRPVNVNSLVYGIIELIQRTAGPGIQVETVSSAELWPAFVDVSQLENALLNLCINARDAMPDGGRIILKTSNQRMDPDSARAHDIEPGQYLCLTVTDTGYGMAPEVMARVFEPFYTTKPIGQGTGLGLSMIYGFAQQSGGQVRIASTPGEGTTVSLYLPRHHGEAPHDDQTVHEASAQPTPQGETVLLVDDEPTVRLLLADVLGELGYTVIQAGDSAAGLKLLRSDVPIDLLVTDVGLPGGINGRQMAEAGQALRPQLKTLFITGYAETTVLGNEQLQACMQVLSKPFTVDALGVRVQQMLAKPAG